MKQKQYTLSTVFIFLITLSTIGLNSSCQFQNNKPSDEEGYKVMVDWPKLPGNFELGQVSGVDVDSKGNA